MTELRSRLTLQGVFSAFVAIVAVVLIWWLSAYPRGILAAWIDGLRDHDEIKALGLRRSSSAEAARLLSTRYGVETDRVAGCAVSQDQQWYVDGYNSVAKPRIEAKFGKDVIDECRDDAEAAECAAWAEEAQRSGR